MNHSILQVRERVPKLAYLPQRNSERGLVSEYLVKGVVTFDFVLGHKKLRNFSQVFAAEILDYKARMSVDI